MPFWLIPSSIARTRCRQRLCMNPNEVCDCCETVTIPLDPENKVGICAFWLNVLETFKL